ncbi:hypothetical protein KQH51_01465 [bacterium]|nr:hypothetical protein [bacterium]MCB2201593.1 hypothetical protein [bacterium]
MSRSLLILLMAVCLCVPVAALPPADESNEASGVDDAMYVDNTTYIAANSILMFVTNHGNFGRDLAATFGNDYGTYFPFTSIADITSGINITSPLYAAGLWLGGKVNGDVRIALSEYSSEYVPGPMSGGTYLPDDPDFHVYRLFADSLAGNPNYDYLTWPVDQGAPVDGLGNPLMRGEQLLWSVFNDADPNQHNNDAGETDPLGIEVRHSVWASDIAEESAIIHIGYELFNRGANTIDSFFISIWLDPDMGGAGDDYVGCDSANQMIFCYNADNDDAQYGSTPAALAVLFEQGPIVASPGDNGWYDDTPVPDHRNLTLHSFNKYINGTDPNDFTETYNYMRGLRADGSPWIDPTTAEETRFAVRGDPVTGTGWIDSSPSDRRMMASYGPFTFNPGDSQYVSLKLGVALGGDRLESLEAVRTLLLYDPEAPLSASIAVEPDYLLPMPREEITITIGSLEGGYTVNDIDQSSVLINGVALDADMSIVPSRPDPASHVLQLSLRALGLLQTYEPIEGEAVRNIEATFWTSDGQDFVADGQFTLVGIIAGDVDGDRAFDLSDLIYMVNYLFLGGPEPVSMEAANVACDAERSVDLSDLIKMVQTLFLGGEAFAPCGQ